MSSTSMYDDDGMITIYGIETMFQRRAGNMDGKIYMVIPCAMGCCYYVKRDGLSKKLQLMGLGNMDLMVPELAENLSKFIEDYTEVKQ